jgi:hypothetical protein
MDLQFLFHLLLLFISSLIQGALSLDVAFLNLIGAMASMVALNLLLKLSTKSSQEKGRIGDGVLFIRSIKSVATSEVV